MSEEGRASLAEILEVGLCVCVCSRELLVGISWEVGVSGEVESIPGLSEWLLRKLGCDVVRRWEIS